MDSEVTSAKARPRRHDLLSRETTLLSDPANRRWRGPGPPRRVPYLQPRTGVCFEQAGRPTGTATGSRSRDAHPFAASADLRAGTPELPARVSFGRSQPRGRASDREGLASRPQLTGDDSRPGDRAPGCHSRGHSRSWSYALHRLSRPSTLALPQLRSILATNLRAPSGPHGGPARGGPEDRLLPRRPLSGQETPGASSAHRAGVHQALRAHTARKTHHARGHLGRLRRRLLGLSRGTRPSARWAARWALRARPPRQRRPWSQRADICEQRSIGPPRPSLAGRSAAPPCTRQVPGHRGLSSLVRPQAVLVDASPAELLLANRPRISRSTL